MKDPISYLNMTGHKKVYATASTHRILAKTSVEDDGEEYFVNSEDNNNLLGKLYKPKLFQISLKKHKKLEYVKIIYNLLDSFTVMPKTDLK